MKHWGPLLQKKVCIFIFDHMSIILYVVTQEIPRFHMVPHLPDSDQKQYIQTYINSLEL